MVKAKLSEGKGRSGKFRAAKRSLSPGLDEHNEWHARRFAPPGEAYYSKEVPDMSYTYPSNGFTTSNSSGYTTISGSGYTRVSGVLSGPGILSYPTISSTWDSAPWDTVPTDAAIESSPRDVREWADRMMAEFTAAGVDANENFRKALLALGAGAKDAAEVMKRLSLIMQTADNQLLSPLTARGSEWTMPSGECVRDGVSLWMSLRHPDVVGYGDELGPKSWVCEDDPSLNGHTIRGW